MKIRFKKEFEKKLEQRTMKFKMEIIEEVFNVSENQFNPTLWV